MAVVKTVHLGGIEKDNQRIKTFAAPSRLELIKELNSWFFDYCYGRGIKIEQLPPLDDWIHSNEDSTYWSVDFPDTNWVVWIRYEPMEFR